MKNECRALLAFYFVLRCDLQNDAYKRSHVDRCFRYSKLDCCFFYEIYSMHKIEYT